MRWTVLAALLVLATGCSDAPAVPGPDPAPPVGSAASPANLDCGAPAEPAPSLPVPEGAVAARMCEAGDFPWQAPQQRLTGEVEALVEVLNAQAEVTDPDRYCFAVGGTGFELRLAYPDGSVVAVPGDTGGCGELALDEKTYDGAEAVLEAFLRGMQDQRAGGTPPPLDRVRLACAGGDWGLGSSLSPIGEPRRLVRAVSCWRANADELGPFDRSRLSARQLRVLVADLVRRTVRRVGFTDSVCRSSDLYYWQDILGQTDWGDVVRVRGICDEFQVNERPSTFWTPGRRAQEILDRLRSRASD